MAETRARKVTRFEGSLLRILRCLFRDEPAEGVWPLLRDTMNCPPRLSSACVNLVRDTLAKGCVLFLVRNGGWRSERFLRDGEPKTGRLWERSPLSELQFAFSRATMDFLLALTARKPPDDGPLRQIDVTKTTLADRLFFAIAYVTLRDEADIAEWLRGCPIVAENGLCRLLYPEDFGDSPADLTHFFADWMQPPGPGIIEALQPIFERRWLDFENARGQIADWQQMRREGESATRVLNAFLMEVERAGRRDLARFMLAVLEKLLAAGEVTPHFWIGGLLGGGPTRFTERLEIQRHALAFLEAAGRLREWEQQARASGYFDEDYAASRFWLGEWERYQADKTATRAAQIVRALEPLRTADE